MDLVKRPISVSGLDISYSPSSIDYYTLLHNRLCGLLSFIGLYGWANRAEDLQNLSSVERCAVVIKRVSRGRRQTRPLASVNADLGEVDLVRCAHVVGMSPFFHALRRYSASSAVVLRPYQESCLQACTDALVSGSTRIGVSLPTGSGKTTVFITLLSRIKPPAQRPTAHRSLVIVNSVELAQQTAAQTAKLFPEWSVEIEQGTKYKASGLADMCVSAAGCRVFLGGTEALGVGRSRRIRRFCGLHGLRSSTLRN